MSTPNLPEQVNVRDIDNLYAPTDKEDVIVGNCDVCGFDDDVVARYEVIDAEIFNFWTCPDCGVECQSIHEVGDDS
jgi:hypothetical protein